MDDMSALTPELVALARSLAERWDAGATHFDSFDTDLADFRSQTESLAEDPIALARVIAAWSGGMPHRRAWRARA